MIKYMIFIAVFAVNAWSINPFTYFWTIKLTGDTATVGKWKANNDSVYNWNIRVSDTINALPRWAQIKSKDSTWRNINIDTLPSVDTTWIKNAKIGKIDSVYTGGLKVLRSGTFDSIYTRALIRTTGDTKIEADTLVLNEGSYNLNATEDVVYANSFTRYTNLAVELNDSIKTITGGPASGTILILQNNNGTDYFISVVEGGNLQLNNNSSFDMKQNDIIAFIKMGSNWYELYRSDMNP